MRDGGKADQGPPLAWPRCDSVSTCSLLRVPRGKGEGVILWKGLCPRSWKYGEKIERHKQSDSFVLSPPGHFRSVTAVNPDHNSRKRAQLWPSEYVQTALHLLPHLTSALAQ